LSGELMSVNLVYVFNCILVWGTDISPHGRFPAKPKANISPPAVNQDSSRLEVLLDSLSGSV